MLRVAMVFLLAMTAPMPLALAVDHAMPDAAHLTDEANKYFTGKGARQDDAHAAALYQQAADTGYARAQHNLGFMYAEGRGVPQDEFKAVDYYRAAMAQSYTPAITSLGIAYAEGRGVSREPHTAATLLRRAAAAGDKRAKDYLARANLPP
jgi:uncharacterized protein